MLILWFINGNAHYHNTDKIPSQDENYILVAPHRTLVGSCLTWHLGPNQSNLSLWQKGTVL